jgi:gliding motility-associated-like protein
VKTFVLLFLVFFMSSYGVFAQRGRIIKAASTAAMDPNQDGYVSKTTAGFSTDGYNVDEFEITMFAIPQVGGDVAGDNTGPSCGITDLIPDNKGSSVYAVKDGNNLIFRFRVGDDNPSVESWTILLDTDGLYGVADPNATAGNPGFEVDITFIKRNNAGVYVYNINGIENCPTPQLSYPISSHFQISIADEVTCGDPDYFYDFYVPFDQLSSTFGITSNSGLRFVALTNVSATCAMAGQIADVSGVDNDAPDYAGCVTCAFAALVDNQCPTAIDDLCQTCGGFEKDKVNKPTIDVPVRAGQTVISGTCDPDIYIKVEVYSRIGGTDAAPIWSTTPREAQGNAANGTTWSVALSGPLQSFDRIVAKAQKDVNSVPCGTAGGNQASASVTVVQPNTAPIALNQSVNVTEDVASNISLTGTDTENDPLIFTVVSPPAHGSLSGTGATVLYTPNSNYFGPDSFTFHVSDGIFSSATPGTVTINVTPVNDAPVASNLVVTTAEETPKAITLAVTDVDGGPLSYEIVVGPAHGTLSGTGANITYTPAPNYNGSDSFTFRANDGTTDSNIATANITVTPVEDAPVANNQSITILEDQVRSIVLTGSDVDGDVLTFIIVANPGHGTLSGSGANITYTPAVNYNGSDSFTFKVNDGTSDSNIATVSITINPVNDSPVALNQALTTPEDTPLPIALNGVDVDGDPMTYSIVTPPLHGSLTGTGANITYTPDVNYNGSDNFTFSVVDGLITSNVATISISVTPVNDAPAASNQNVILPEDVSTSITLSATDLEGTALTYSIVTPPSHGILIGTAPNVTYSPALNYNGPDNFTFKANDGEFDSNNATVSITVTPVNDAPVANDQSINYLLNTPRAITLTGSDVEGSALTYIVLSNPSHGVLSGTAPNIVYTPDNGYTGPDSFTFKVNDGTTDSNVATVSLFLDPGVNVGPTANDQSIVLAEDVPTVIVLTATDPNADPLTFSIVSLPANGSVSISGANAVYTPALHYNGSDSFTFKANDGTVDSNIATVSLTITPVNDAPIANSQNVSTNEGIAKAISLTATDPDGDVVTYTIVTPPTHGSLTGTAPNLTYTPTPGFTGVDNLTFTANDGALDSSPATVAIIISSTNDLPVASSQNVNTNEDVLATITLTGIDADLDPLTYSVVALPLHGTLTGTAPNLTYTPALNYNGPDVIMFKVNDGTGDSNTATVSIAVSPVNDLPEAQSQTLTTPEDISLPINLVVSDPDDDAVTWVVVTLPLHGTLTGIGPNFTYQPNINYNGSDSFTFAANDGTTNSNTGTVSIDVTPVPDLPTAFDQGGASTTTQENVPIDITLVGSDPDGDALTYIIVTHPAHGTLTGSGPDQVYTPDAGYTGPDDFTFKVNDGTGDSNTATVTIMVVPVTNAPVADEQDLTLDEDSTIAFTLTASDVDGDLLSYTILSQVTHGSITGTLPTLTYTPAPNYNGADGLTFKVGDGSSDSNIATIGFTVTPVNDAPLLSPIPDLVMPEDSTRQVCLNAIDVDGELIIFGQPLNQSGGGTMIRDVAPFNFCYIFTPPPNYNGESLWTMSVSDASGATASADLKITITPVNDAPTAVDDLITVLRHVPTDGDVLANDMDIDGDAVAITLAPVTPPAHGTITLRADGSFTYQSERTYRGPDSMEYEICDPATPSLCSRATLSITIVDEPFKVYEGVTPNGDGDNDYLRIEGIDYYTENTVQIFDRYNNLVFEVRGYDNEEKVWRGQSNKGISGGGLPEGTYFYVVNLGDNSRPRNGFVVLKRN